MSEVTTAPLRKAADASVLVVGVGAWQGLGAAIARRFAGGGHPVVIAGRNAPKLEATAAELKKAGARAVCAVGDAALAEDARRFAAEAQRLAPLAVAVHNAGGNEPAPFLEVTEASFTRHVIRSCRRAALRTACSNPMPSRTRTGCCTTSTAAPGHSSSTCGRGKRAFDPPGRRPAACVLKIRERLPIPHA